MDEFVPCIHCHFEHPKGALILGKMCCLCAADSMLGRIDFSKQRIVRPDDWFGTEDTMPGLFRPGVCFPKQHIKEGKVALPRKAALGSLADLNALPELIELVVRGEPDPHDIMDGVDQEKCECPMGSIMRLTLGDIDPTARVCVDCGRVWSELTDADREARANQLQTPLRGLARFHRNPFEMFGRGRAEEAEAAIYKRLIEQVQKELQPLLTKAEELSRDQITGVWDLVQQAKEARTLKEKYDLLQDLLVALVGVFADTSPVSPEDFGEAGETVPVEFGDNWTARSIAGVDGEGEDVDSRLDYSAAERRLMTKITGIHPIYTALTTNPVYVTSVSGGRNGEQAKVHVAFTTVDPTDEEAKRLELERGYRNGVKGSVEFEVPHESYLAASKAWTELIGKTIPFEVRGNTSALVEDPITGEPIATTLDCSAQGDFVPSIKPSLEQVKRYLKMEKAAKTLEKLGSHVRLLPGFLSAEADSPAIVFLTGDIFYDPDSESWRPVKKQIGQPVPDTAKTVFCRPKVLIDMPYGEREDALFGES
jgi:hypothetical protein